MTTRKSSSNTLVSSLDFAQRVKKLNAQSSEDDLPPGWVRKESRSKPGAFYYSHPSTNRTQLHHPGRPKGSRSALTSSTNSGSKDSGCKFTANADDIYGDEVLSIDGSSISDGEWELLTREREENEDPEQLEKRKKEEEERKKQDELYKALQEARKRRAEEQERAIAEEPEAVEEWKLKAMEKRARERAARVAQIQEMEEEEIQAKKEKKEKKQKKKEEEEARQRQDEKDREAARKQEEMRKYEEQLARRRQEKQYQESRKVALEAKDLGNKAFQAQNFTEAIKHYSKAIEFDPTDAVFFSNRSGAYASCSLFDKALSDAEECLRLKPDWWKGYSRKGMAEFKLGHLTDSQKSFKKGLELQPDEQSLKDGLDQVRAAGEMIFRPSLSNPKAQEEIERQKAQEAAQKAEEVRKREAHVARQRQEEIERQAARQQQERKEREEADRKREEKSREDKMIAEAMRAAELALARERGQEVHKHLNHQPSDPPRPPSRHEQSNSHNRKRSRSRREAKRSRSRKRRSSSRPRRSREAALEAKDLGNKAFQAQSFTEALRHYSKAIELDPSDAVFFSNRSGAYASCSRFKEALNDAKECMRLRPEWWKGYSRKAMAEFKLGNLADSEASFKKGLAIQPDEQSLKDGLAQVRLAVAIGMKR